MKVENFLCGNQCLEPIHLCKRKVNGPDGNHCHFSFGLIHVTSIPLYQTPPPKKQIASH